MTKTAKSKLKCPDGWTLILTDNKYAALHKESQFQTALCGEKEGAIKLAISYEQQNRYYGKFPTLTPGAIQSSVSDSEEELPLGWMITGEEPLAVAQHKESGAKTLPFGTIKLAIQAAHEMEKNGDLIRVKGKPLKEYTSSQIGNDARAVRDIPITRIQPSPDNPRKHFDEAELAELTTSIRERGVEIPIAVLPARAFGMHTIIYGERRWRASQEAGKDTIPALVLDISDERADEMRFNENHQRKNLTPLEEAAWFQRRIEIYGKTVQDIAAHSGYSTKTIAKRLRLNSLPETAKEALVEGALCLGSALALARLDDPKQMAEATDVFLRNNWYAYHSDPKRAADYIEQQYFTRLAKAPFNVKDITLLPEAGSCLDCSKRTGNQSELFDDVKEKDSCLDRKCYDRKCAAQVQRELATAEAKGLKVLNEKEIKAIVPNGFINSDYVELSDQPWQDKKNRSWKQLLGKNAPEPVIAVIKGQVKRLVPKAAAAEVVKQQHNITIELDRKASTGSSSAADEKRAQKVRQAIAKETLVALHAHALASFRGKLPGSALPFWRAMGDLAICNLSVNEENYLCKVLELEPLKNKYESADYGFTLRAHLKILSTSAACAALIVQMLAVRKLHGWSQPYSGDKLGDEHKALCEAIGFDLTAAMKQAKAATKAKGQAQSAKAK
jgi:ParB/RepB/Spo0J family partition protein